MRYCKIVSIIYKRLFIDEDAKSGTNYLYNTCKSKICNPLGQSYIYNTYRQYM